jgi:DNA-binding FrmR family transcriptional regulator
MAHTSQNKKKLLDRVRRIRGQVESIEKALEQETDCNQVLQTIAACRGAINGLMAEVLEGHIRTHLINPVHPPSTEQSEALDQVVDILKTYLK